ncbi:NAD/FAD-utilizing enzyme [Paraglaciecola hydrolytica]|uniref:NAD/FAD-utilizing enzyme n=1 Tax=Paraglaciecola hydrolytica TaxID=1799789 RepID=A0A148KM41_9ALTE|nr:NAD/FAD-utilizing enzyme [Paraglaciecola hydrolytica]KXI27329.1 NAD/FAD-utilizing enzyme [Paraglaciecola hydrolytica]
MQRHYYISDDLSELETIENELQAKGVLSPQIHVLSDNDAEVEKHHLHAIEPVLKKDVVRSTEVGAILGLVGAGLVLVVTYLMQWHQSPIGWLPFIFSALVTLGFCTWQGGLIGIQLPHHQFKRFQELLQKGQHVFFVDIEHKQEAILTSVVNQHPNLKSAGTGKATPSWIVKGQHKFSHVMKVMP